MNNGMIDTLRQEIRNTSNPEKAKFLQGFFKTKKGEYGEGDHFLGLTVPQSRRIAKKFRELPLQDIDMLLQSPIHEERLIALYILISLFNTSTRNNQKKVYYFYLRHTKWINNWDLVDSSAEQIVGAYTYGKGIQKLKTLATSSSIWERRIAIISTFYYIKRNKSEEVITIATILLQDSHDLIHKAVGWMLREMGKRVSEEILCTFLDTHATTMPRTMLRYSIERLPIDRKKYYLTKK